MKTAFVLAWFVLSFVFSPSSFALGGKLKQLSFESEQKNWSVTHPQVVIAFGYLQHSLVEHYAEVTQNLVSDLRKTVPSLEFQWVSWAKGSDLVDVLKNPNTVGLVFIAHTFFSEKTQGAMLIAADGHPLPLNILSAATPALRFVSFFGCHGPSLLGEYEIQWQLERLPGSQTFFYSSDRYLSAGFLYLDNLKKVLARQMDSLKESEILSLDSLSDPLRTEAPRPASGRITLRVKDVFAYLEPRYVSINGKIVGVLGSDESHSNFEDEWREVSFAVDDSVFAAKKPQEICHKVKIIAADVSPGARLDDYLLGAVTLEGSFGVREKAYDPPLHFGGKEVATERSGGVAHEVPLRPQGLAKLSPKKWRLWREAVEKEIRLQGKTDPNPETWRRSPVKGRFFIDCI
ncbi:MAG: hypothetical protein ACO3A2_02370 [Bdellovibrionia bacterium]